MAGTIGLVQNDIKRVLAYSTVSQLGYMFLAMGVGAFGAGIFHLYTHAFFKALLFSMARAAAVDRMEAAAHAGHPEVAGQWADDLYGSANDTGAAWAAAASAHGRALINEGSAAEAHFIRALQFKRLLSAL